MAKKYTIERIVKRLEKEPFLGEDIIVAIRGEEGKADFLGEKVAEFFHIFEKKEDIKIILWLMPKYSVEFSEGIEKLVPTIDDVAQIVGKGTEPISLKNIDAVVEELDRIKGAYIKEGGLLLAGDDLEEMITVGNVMEKAALVLIESKPLGSAKGFKPEEAEERRKIYTDVYSQIRNKTIEEEEVPTEKIEISDVENELRIEIVKAGRTLLKNNLAISTWGNISARLDEEWILLTPSGIPYANLKAEDIVKVNVETNEKIGRLSPTSELDLHTKIYKMDREAGAVIHAHGLYGSVFAGLGKTLPVVSRVMKEAVNGPLNMVPYSESGTEKLAKDTVAVMEKYDVKAVLLESHGTVNYAKSLKDALLDCALVDKCAKIYIDRKKGIFE